MIDLLFSKTGGYIALGLAVFLMGWLTLEKIQADERARIERNAILESQDRVKKLEKRNEENKSLSDRDRCLAIMRDSGLPESNCP